MSHWVNHIIKELGRHAVIHGSRELPRMMGDASRSLQNRKYQSTYVSDSSYLKEQQRQREEEQQKAEQIKVEQRRANERARAERARAERLRIQQERERNWAIAGGILFVIVLVSGIFFFL